jgi:hypothetical protein
MRELQNNNNPENNKEAETKLKSYLAYLWQDGLDLFSRISALITIFGWLLI